MERSSLVVMGFIKSSSTGITREELIEKCCENNINDPLTTVKALISEGMVRFDNSGNHQAKFKATKKAFS